MKLLRLSFLVALHTTCIILCDTTLVVSPQKAYIASAAQEWAQNHLAALDPYQLQLLTSNLNLLCEQAVHTTNVEMLRQRIIWATCEIVGQNNLNNLNTLPSDCDNLAQITPHLYDVTNSLQTCTECIEKLEPLQAHAILNALDAVAAIGRTALTYHDENLTTQVAKNREHMQALLHELSTCTTALQEIDAVANTQEYKQLIQFYALRNVITKATGNAWAIIGINMHNTIEHLELIQTCSLVFETCFTLAHERLMNQEVPAQYQTLLFVIPNL